MNHKVLYLSFFMLGLFVAPQNTSAQDSAPIANDDFFNVDEDSSLSVSAPGLFINDDLPADSLFAVLVSAPTNGVVELNEDGSFVYTPNLGFDGTDSFSYMIETLPMQVLEVDTTQSSLNFDMTVSIALGTATDNVDGRIGGEASFFLHPETAPFNEAQLYGLNLVVVDSLDLEFVFGSLIVLGRLLVDADTSAFTLSLSERGSPSDVIDGIFVQTGNKINVTGTVNLEGKGLLDGQVPTDPQEFDTETDADITMNLMLEDTALTVEIPVLLEEEFQLSGNDVELTVTGMLLASGQLKQPAQSNVATVSITVDPIFRTDVDRELPFQYALSQNYPNPFNPVTTIAFSIPTAEHVTLKIYDMLGREVATLVDGLQAPGIHEVQFDAGNLPSGMYAYRLEAEGFSDVKKLVLLK